MIGRAQSALSFIPANNRETWVAMGMAVKSEFGESGFDMWDEWSQTADNYNAAAARSVWKSCRGSGVTLGTLFHSAQSHGWRDGGEHERPSKEVLQARQDEAYRRITHDGIAREKEQHAAAKKAAWILHQCKLEQHAYLHRKGWQDLQGPVWRTNEGNNFLCIPMRVGPNLVGLQMIDRDGNKRFLSGQRTSGAEHVIENSGRGAEDWFVEGYATGLSLRICLQSLKMRYRIHITFSASNLVKVAALCPIGYVIADNDLSGTGERVAVKTGMPHYLPPTGDLNDLHQAQGTFKTSQILRKWLTQAKENRVE